MGREEDESHVNKTKNNGLKDYKREGNRNCFSEYMEIGITSQLCVRPTEDGHTRETKEERNRGRSAFRDEVSKDDFYEETGSACW